MVLCGMVRELEANMTGDFFEFGFSTWVLRAAFTRVREEGVGMTAKLSRWAFSIRLLGPVLCGGRRTDAVAVDSVIVFDGLTRLRKVLGTLL